MMLFRTTDLCDMYGESLQVAEPVLTAYGGRSQFFGPIATVRVHEDNKLVRESLENLPAGAVLVVDGGASRRCALLGDRLAAIAVERGLAGVIINGAVRDTVALRGLGVGVLALAPSPRRSGKAGRGERGVELEFAGVRWVPGHFVYADQDGVILSPQPLPLEVG